jgi:hypothetical protein
MILFLAPWNVLCSWRNAKEESIMMKQNVLYAHKGVDLVEQLGRNGLRFPRRTVIATILLVALMAFELFNFDTTRYALTNLLGPVSFMGMGWASILAVAFCAIDFAGLVRLFTPESGGEQPREVWYLMGAWLLGATMNALMTWWAVSLTLLNHDFGNEVLSRGQLLQIVPIFVATLVWLTRILFIGALTVTGSHLLFARGKSDEGRGASGRMSPPSGRPLREREAQALASGGLSITGRVGAQHDLPSVTDEVPDFLRERGRSDGVARKIREAQTERSPANEPRNLPLEAAETQVTMRRAASEEQGERHRRVRQRPPMPGSNGHGSR